MARGLAPQHANMESNTQQQSSLISPAVSRTDHRTEGSTGLRNETKPFRGKKRMTIPQTEDDDDEADCSRLFSFFDQWASIPLVDSCWKNCPSTGRCSRCFADIFPTECEKTPSTKRVGSHRSGRGAYILATQTARRAQMRRRGQPPVDPLFLDTIRNKIHSHFFGSQQHAHAQTASHSPL